MKEQTPLLRECGYAASSIIGLVLIGICSTVYFVMSHTASEDHRKIEQGVYVYASSEPLMAALAKELAKTHGTQTLDAVSVPEATVRHRLGFIPKSIPVLVVGKEGSQSVVSGLGAIHDYIDHSPKELFRSDGQRAILMMAAIIMVSFWVAQSIARRIGGIMPILGAIGIAGLVGGCITCSSGGNVAGLMPLFAAAFLTVGSLVFLRKTISINGLVVVLLFSLLSLGFQFLLQIYDPKFCPSCLILTAVASVWTVACLDGIQRRRVDGINLGPRFGTIVLVLTVLFIGKYSAESVDINVFPPDKRPIAALLGEPMNDFVRGRQLDGRKLIVIVQSYCGACEIALAQLPSFGVPYEVIPACTIAVGAPCFDTTEVSLVTPAFFVLGEELEVVYQRFGWPSNEQGLRNLRNEFAEQLQRNPASANTANGGSSQK